ncbi:MAG: hypothetical protein WBX01_08080 [Nitrososphaeraceae archaeon]
MAKIDEQECFPVSLLPKQDQGCCGDTYELLDRSRIIRTLSMQAFVDIAEASEFETSSNKDIANDGQTDAARRLEN